MKLRAYFNKKFDGLMAIKENEMALTKQRNDRLRHIQDELNKLEELKNSDIVHRREIVDPIFEPDEMPETIVKVFDSQGFF